jgi:hypothetical protein
VGDEEARASWRRAGAASGDPVCDDQHGRRSRGNALIGFVGTSSRMRSRRSPDRATGSCCRCRCWSAAVSSCRRRDRARRCRRARFRSARTAFFGAPFAPLRTSARRRRSAQQRARARSRPSGSAGATSWTVLGRARRLGDSIRAEQRRQDQPDARDRRVGRASGRDSAGRRSVARAAPEGRGPAGRHRSADAPAARGHERRGVRPARPDAVRLLYRPRGAGGFRRSCVGHGQARLGRARGQAAGHALRR